MSAEEARDRVRSREGEELTCTRKAARRSSTLSNWIDNTADEGAFQAEAIPVAVLRVILGFCEDDESSPLASHSVAELFAVMEGANWLDAPDAFSAAARQLNSRFLVGKSAEELRTNLGAANDLSQEEQAAALAEPAFTPPPSQEPVEADDVLELALEKVDAMALRQLKAVSAAWRAPARRELCKRLCHCEGRPKPTGFADITDLDVECLNDAGTPWDAVAAGRQLPQLARLHGFGFVVDVQAVRQAVLDDASHHAAHAALRNCIQGEGEPPDELLLAAVACAASGTVLGVPVQRLREDEAIGSLDYIPIDSCFGVLSAELLGLMLPAATSVHTLSLHLHRLDTERGAAIAEGLKGNSTLQTLHLSANLSANDSVTACTFALAALLEETQIRHLDLWGNNLGPEGGAALAGVLRGNSTLQSLKCHSVGSNDITGDDAEFLAAVVLEHASK